MTITVPVKLMQYSHGAGCGCKIAPEVLEQILADNYASPDFEGLLVGNRSKDDAAVFDLGNGSAMISTTDFFMPIVDDPFDFGRIASVNAISDIYAMGGKPLMAISILGWPVNDIPAEVAGEVIKGAREVCAKANIPLAGGHSIDTKEPVFGLAVSGIIKKEHIKQNNTAREGDMLFLTKPLGIGILGTAIKKGLISEEDYAQMIRYTTLLNSVGYELARQEWVNAMTDVTGFGLLGHLIEMCEGSGLSAEIEFAKVPMIPSVDTYLQQGCAPGGTERNWQSYSHKVDGVTDEIKARLCDPQTSGGLLVAVGHKEADLFKELMADASTEAVSEPIGMITGRKTKAVMLV